MGSSNQSSEQIEALGLSLSEAKKRLGIYGKNEIHITKKQNILKRWLNQFNNILIYILLITAVITAGLHHWVDMSVIVGVVILNALIGFIQEEKAEKAIEALKEMLPLQADVIRDGKRFRIPAEELVPDDVVFLESGDKVPADMRLLKSNNLQINEAMLTGESVPVEKKPESVSYSGTFITYGTGIGTVIATGKNTEVGRISTMLTKTPKFSTPLLRQINAFGRWLALIILCFSFIAFLFGIFIHHYPINDMLMAAIAIAVSVIPEGLPAIISITLAIGVTRMARRHAITRRLASVETLSSVTVICTDKTGTLTKNELTVQKIITRNNTYDVTGDGYNDSGKIMQNGDETIVTKDSNLSMFIRSGILCNEAELNKKNNRWQLIGNPMDGALLALGLKAHMHYKHEISHYPKTDTIPFDSAYKFMASLHHDHEGHSFIFVKGAPEKILSLCTGEIHNNATHTLNKSYWLSQTNQLAENGMRVLALAFRKSDQNHINLTFKEVEKDLIILGIVGIIDPPRAEAREAVSRCQRAGMRIKMVTGDHRLTAQAIAKQVGITKQSVLSGENIDVMSDEKLAELVDDVDIYARTAPEHKVRLINALKKQHHIVAMTGDGVNDAPALKSADIGIAMGIKGTDVAKEAAEMVLADDNFASIKNAVEEGRNVYKNIKKAILFVLPSNGAEGITIFLAVLLGYTLPITPLQILWINMITAVSLGLALAFEPPEKNLMQEKPRDPKEPLLSKFLLWRLGFVSFLFVFCLFGLFLYETKNGTHIALARTMVVNALALIEAVYLINCRRIRGSSFNVKGLFGSKPALIAIGFVIVSQLAFTYLPFMQGFFNTQPVHLSQWGIIIAIALGIFFIVELEKMLFRRFYMLRHPVA